MIKASIEQWRKLYESALDLFALNPWALMTVNDIITLRNPVSEEPLYFAFMSNDDSSCDISCLIGTEGLQGFMDIHSNGGNYLIEELLFLQRSLIACFGTRRDLAQEDLALINELNLTFKKDGEWLYFRSFEPGYVPWPMSKDEVLLLTEAYRQLDCAIRYIIDGNPLPGKGRTLVSTLDPLTNTWIIDTAPLVCPPRQFELAAVTDELLFARLMRRPLVDARLELDLFNVLIAIEDDALKKPFYPFMALLADNLSGSIVEFEMFTPENSELDHLLALIFGFIQKHGRPLIIYVQNHKLKCVLAKLCERLMIPLELVNFLPSINAFKLEKGITKYEE